MFLRSLLAASVAAAGLPTAAMAGGGCCAHCGCGASRCRRICRLVREDRKITAICWGMECEDVCVNGPSTPDCKHCEVVCANGPGDQDICVNPKKLVWTSWIPGCGPDIFTKRKLMKKTVTKTVPSFKWVVEDACPQCIATLEPVSVPAGIEIPAPRKVDGAMVIASRTEK